MRKCSVILVCSLVLVGVGSSSFAGMMDEMLQKSNEATQKVNEANTKAQETGQALQTESKKVNEAQESATQQSGDLSEQLREAAKEKSNETIDRLGR